MKGTMDQEPKEGPYVRGVAWRREFIKGKRPVLH